MQHTVLMLLFALGALKKKQETKKSKPYNVIRYSFHSPSLASIHWELFRYYLPLLLWRPNKTFQHWFKRSWMGPGGWGQRGWRMLSRATFIQTDFISFLQWRGKMTKKNQLRVHVLYGLRCFSPCQYLNEHFLLAYFSTFSSIIAAPPSTFLNMFTPRSPVCLLSPTYSSTFNHN